MRTEYCVARIAAGALVGCVALLSSACGLISQGPQTHTAEHQASTGTPSGWSQVANPSTWDSRTGSFSTVYNGKLWVMGGIRDSWPPALNDIWYSNTGGDPVDDWQKVPAGTWWSGREGGGTVVFDPDGAGASYPERMYVLGGMLNLFNPYNDVWWTEDTTPGDGLTWSTATAEWSKRYFFGSLVFDAGEGEKIWVLGGQTTKTSYVGDVWSWSGIAGQPWQKATGSAWPSRGGAYCTVWNGAMWVFGGHNADGKLNDVWYSTDGTTWTNPGNANWPARSLGGLVQIGTGLWLFGGSDSSSKTNDVWFTDDPQGLSWTLQNPSAGWPPRHMQTVTKFKGDVFLAGGWSTSRTTLNDIWMLRMAPGDRRWQP